MCSFAYTQIVKSNRWMYFSCRDDSEETIGLLAEMSRSRLVKLYRSKKALAIPVTYLILFVSTLGIIAVTYYYSIQRIDARSVSLRDSMAEQGMESLDQTASSVLWQPGSSKTLQIDDYGGELVVQPSTNQLLVNVTDNNGISNTIFNATVGQVVYELPYSESSDAGLFLDGDSSPISNQTGSATAQLYIRNGPEHIEIALQYRPIVSVATYVSEDNTTVYDIRIYVVNLNSSQSIDSMGTVPLEVSCLQNTVTTYNVTYPTGTLTINANLNGAQGQVSVPITGGDNSAEVNLNLILCNVKIENWSR